MEQKGNILKEKKRNQDVSVAENNILQIIAGCDVIIEYLMDNKNGDCAENQVHEKEIDMIIEQGFDKVVQVDSSIDNKTER